MPAPVQSLEDVLDDVLGSSQVPDHNYGQVYELKMMLAEELSHSLRCRGCALPSRYGDDRGTRAACD